jgi:outer membrane protein OmpA-like peptidoglycan-associated protein
MIIKMNRKTRGFLLLVFGVGLILNARTQNFESYSKFDFIPGEEVIFYDDFADIPLGDFPMNWDTDASAEVVALSTYQGKWLKLKGDYAYFMPLVKMDVLPENFTFEFELLYSTELEFSVEIIEYNENGFPSGYYPGKGGTYIGFFPDYIIWKNYSNMEDDEQREGDGTQTYVEAEQKIKYAVWGQKTRLRVYCNQEKVLDVPRGINPSFSLNCIRIANYPDAELFISGVRFAVGAPDTRSRLLTEGKLVTRGITFDSGKDQIKPESYPVLKEIAQVLQENPEVQVRIIGHTDSDGDENLNMNLSVKRSEAVKKALVDKFGINAGRLETDGKGESEPVSPNTTPEGKANNRRVEFIKI